MGSGTAAALHVAGGLIADELKGDYLGASAVAGQALEEARAAGDGAAVADGQLAVGLVAALAGDSAQAERQLEAATPGLSGADAQLAQVLLSLARQARDCELPTGARATSAVAAPPDRHATSAVVMMNARAPAGLNRGPESLDLPFDVEPPSADPAPLPFELEARARAVPEQRYDDRTAALVASLLIAMPRLRVTGVDAAADPLAQLLPADVEAPEAWRAYALRAAAELLLRAGREREGLACLGDAIKRYEGLGDAIGAGACHLLRGDLLCTPFSPAGLGFAIVESQFGAGSELPWSLEGREPRQAATAPDVAIAAYELARACFGGAGVVAPRALATLALRDGFVAHLAGDSRTARAQATGARTVFDAAGDTRGARLATMHATVYAIAGDDSGSVAEAELKRDMQRIGAWGAGGGGFAHALGLGLLLGRVARRWHTRVIDPERALRAYRLAHAVYEALGAEQNAIQTLADMAELHAQLGDWTNAQLSYHEAEQRARESTVPADRYAESILRARRAIRRQRVAGEYLRVLAARGATNELDALREGLEQLVDDAQAIALPAGGRRVEVAVVADEVRTTLLPTIAVFVHVLRALGSTKLRRKETRAAIETARALGRKDLEAIAHEALGSREQAALVYEEFVAAAAGDDPVERGTQIAMLVRVGAFERAEDLIGDLVAGGRSDEDVLQEIRWLARDDLGLLHEDRKAPDKAIAVYEAEMKRIEDGRARLTLDELRVAQTQSRSVARLYLHATRAALMLAEDPANDDATRTHWRAQAFTYSERGRARALLDLMDSRPELELGPGDEVRRWRAAGARLQLAQQELAAAVGQRGELAAALNDEVAAAQDALNRCVRELERVKPGWRTYVSTATDVLTVDEVCERLRRSPGTLLLQYHFFDRDFLAWAITAEHGLTHAVHTPLADPDELPARMRAFADACESTNVPGLWLRRGTVLAAELLEPFRELLTDRSYTRLVIVPFGIAHRIPFAALPLDGVALVKTHVVSVLPSASAIAFVAEAADLRAGPMLALGDPANLGHRLKPVPWAGAAAAFAAEQRAGSTLLLGRDATKERLGAELKQGFQIVLFATHAGLGEDPPSAALALADKQDLELYELLGLDLRRTALVVVAACSTGIGAITRGDEVIALTRGLLAAGAQRLVVTLRDAYATSLPLFVRSLCLHLGSGLDAAAALAATQREFIGLSGQQAADAYAELKLAATGVPYAIGERVPHTPAEGYAHPRHWAPYVLVGT